MSKKSAALEQKIRQLNDQGRALHIAGKLDEAEPLFREVLQVDSGDPEALHRLGLILDARGQQIPAIELMQRSILRAPTVPEFFNNLGEAQRKARRRADAQRSYERALQLRPGWADALNNMALVLVDVGDQRAEDFARQAVRAAPNIPQIHMTLGNILFQKHNYRGAVAELREGLRSIPDEIGSQRLLIASLAALNEPIDAFIESPPACLKLVDVYEAAAEGYFAVGRWDVARTYVDRVLAIDPNHVMALTHLGNLLVESGKPAEAIDPLQRALTTCDVPGIRQCLSFAYLAMGNLKEGFREYEHRAKAPAPMDRGKDIPLWTGEQPVDGKTILLMGEQGIGDSIQFVRYAPMLASLGAKVQIQIGAPAVGLLGTVPGVERVFNTQQPVKNVDLYCLMASLPFVFGTEVETIPGNVPYLHAAENRVQQWRERFGKRSDAKLKVGIVWQGNPSHARDRARSIPLAKLAPLAEVNGVALYSLQKNEGREQIAAAGLPIEDLSMQLETLEDTAAAITALDLVISVDTSVAHLAGALGRPVWAMLAMPSDWRWLLGRTDSPWYPSMKLYRQGAPAAWAEVVERVKADLISLRG